MVNTLHTVCFTHGLAIYEIKRVMSHNSLFYNLISEFLAFNQFSKQMNTSPIYQAKKAVIFDQLVSFNLKYCS